MASWPVPEEMTIEYARAQDVRRSTELGGPRQAVFEARSLVIPGDGVELRAVLYRPTSLVAPGILVWLHGGGWVAGSTAASDDQLRALANASSCALLSVDYRLAPEHRFPTPAADALAALRWAAANAPALGAERRVAVGGASAGGNLAAAVTLLARDWDGPAIDFQLLFYPATCRDLDDAVSRKRYADGYWLTAAEMRWFWAHYLARDHDARSPYASPLLAESLADLPPAFILLAECDVLYDEGRRYAARLAEHGVTTELSVYEGMLHGFVACGGVVDAAWDALRDGGRAVREGLLLCRAHGP